MTEGNFEAGLQRAESSPATGRRELLGLGLVLILFAATHLQGIGEAYLAGHQGFNGALRSIIGRNYARYGFWNLRLRPVKNIGPVDASTPQVMHWHHPPLVHMLVGAAFLVFGESEAAARAVPVAFGFLSVLLLWRIVRRFWGGAGGLLAAAAFCLFPLEIEYGSMPNYEALVIAFMLGALWSVLKIRETGALWPRIALFAFTALAGFTDWPAFILAAFAGVGLILVRPRRVGLFAAYGLFCAFWAAVLWHWLDGFSDAGGLSGLARWRAGHTTPVVMSLWWRRFFLRLWDYIGPPFLLLAVAGLAAHAVRRRIPAVTGVFGVGGMLYLLIFRYGSWVHVFFLSYLLPALAELAAAGVVETARLALRMEARLAARLQAWHADSRIGIPVKAAARLAVSRPGGMALAAAVLWMFWMIPVQARLLDRARRVSREIPVSSMERQPQAPYAGRLDAVILASTARSMSGFRDVVAVHARTVSSPQFRYYLDRRNRVVNHSSQLRGERLYIVPERMLSASEKEHFLAHFRVVSLLRYWIVDLHAAAPSFERRVFSPRPPSFFWRMLISRFYPPYRMQIVSR